MDAIREAETPIFEESAVESRQVSYKSTVYMAMYYNVHYAME